MKTLAQLAAYLKREFPNQSTLVRHEVTNYKGQVHQNTYRAYVGDSDLLSIGFGWSREFNTAQELIDNIVTLVKEFKG